ncbi:2-amino-4-hydroxy-6-hydroxymethyldihydropteridine diphosphokinase [Alicyclobacillaceae bacterium I2511]|nr:2-amino-4-hydroxy-6-hydroxymethyldihydropteridine diphosphokinase [Alicyclobacillaceae bacterium I2511]
MHKTSPNFCTQPISDGSHRVVVSLGSNLGRRIINLHTAVTALVKIAVSDVGCSAVYETNPVGYLDQGKFLNMVACFHTQLQVRELLSYLQQVETACGRRRTIRNGPRTLDLDILLYDQEYVCYRDLQVPHPRMWQRGFVLVPLAELLPDTRLLGGETVYQLAKSWVATEEVRYVGRFW